MLRIWIRSGIGSRSRFGRVPIHGFAIGECRCEFQESLRAIGQTGLTSSLPSLKTLGRGAGEHPRGSPERNIDERLVQPRTVFGTVSDESPSLGTHRTQTSMNHRMRRTTALLVTGSLLVLLSGSRPAGQVSYMRDGYGAVMASPARAGVLYTYTVIASTADMGGGAPYEPSINNSGQVAFNAPIGTIRGDGGPLTTIDRNSQSAPNTNGTVSINSSGGGDNEGVLAFLRPMDCRGRWCWCSYDCRSR